MEEIKAQSAEFIQLLREYHGLTKNWIWRCYGMGLAWTILLITSAMLAFLPVSRLYFVAKYNEYNAVKSTIETARSLHNKADFELRGIQQVAAQWNGWVAYWKSWNQVPVIDFYIPDDIKSLEPIQ